MKLRNHTHFALHWKFLIPMAALGAATSFAASWTSLSSPDRLYANPTGTMIGIGVNPPLYPLHVVGRGFISNATASTDALSVTQTPASGSILKLTQGTTQRMLVQHDGKVRIGTGTPTVELDVAGRIRSVYNGGDILWGDSYNSTFGVTTTNNDFGIRTQQTGNAMLTVKTTGRVGIGTASPGAYLHVSGAGVGGGESGIDLTNTVSQGRTYKLSSGIKNVNEAGFTILDRTAGDVPRMVINSSGNVGIGATTPQEKLDVLGGVRLTDGTNGTLTLYGDSDGAKMVVGKLQGGNRDFRIEDATNGETMRVASDGTLFVKRHAFAHWSPTSKTLSLGDIMGGDDVTAGGAGENLVLRTTDREHVRLNRLGMLGVGNSNDPNDAANPMRNSVPDPRVEMDVRDSWHDADQLASLFLTGGGSTGGGAIRFFQNTTEQATIRTDDANGDLRFEVGGTGPNGTASERVRFKANGDVTVSGNIHVAGVTTRTWTVAPDYVFEKDYKLASLDEVDAFVKKNKHLPEVPSAKEFKEKGMDLAEMNFTLLKKVEELTLHAIRLEKEMKRQSEEIRLLKTQR